MHGPTGIVWANLTTCSLQYPTVEVMAQKIRFAALHCMSIDTD
jgi:hypothetical protein